MTRRSNRWWPRAFEYGSAQATKWCTPNNHLALGRGARILAAGVSRGHNVEAECPQDTVLLAYVEGGLVATHASTIDLHLARCAHCQEVLRLFAAVTVSPGEPVSDQRPSVPSRYRLRGRLGRGGQATVWRAWDETLEREVALKLVDLVDEHHRQRLQREARALAQLSHPHVLAVYDIDMGGDPGFISTPVCEGSLAAEVGQAQPWARVLATMRQAAEGLWAVHAAGLVHRDIKPANLLRDPGGMIKIGDFGLVVTPAISQPAMRSDGEHPEQGAGITRVQATLTGACGTPGYLAPEVIQGALHDAGSDQYAFFVTLYQLLAGRLPTARDRWGGIDSVPGWVQRVVDRGLSRRPHDRFATMRAAARALRRPVRSRRAGAWLAGAVALGAVGVAVPRAQPVLPTCEPRPLTRWSPTIDAAIEASAHPKAAARTQTLQADITSFVDGWQQLDRALCQTGRSEGRRCLQRVAERVEAMTTRLAVGDLRPAGIDSVARLMPEMISFEHCGRIEDRDGVVTDIDPAARADAVAAVHGAYAEELLGDRAAARRGLAEALEQGALDPFPDLHATALRRSASHGLRQADQTFESLDARLQLAERLAMEGDAPVIQVRVWLELVNVTIGDVVLSRRYLEFAESALERAGNPAPERMRKLFTEAVVATHAHDYAAVVDFADRAELMAEQLGASAFVGQTLMTSGRAMTLQNRFDDGLDRLQRAQAIARRSYGVEHPTTYHAEHRLASAYREAGQLDRATAAFEDQLERLSVSHPGSAMFALVQEGLAMVRVDAGDWDEARRLFLEVRAYFARMGDPRREGSALANLAQVDEFQGRWAEAVVAYTAAFSLLEDVVPPGAPTLVTISKALARAKSQAEAAQSGPVSSGDVRSTNEHPE